MVQQVGTGGSGRVFESRGFLLLRHAGVDLEAGSADPERTAAACGARRFGAPGAHYNLPMHLSSRGRRPPGLARSGSWAATGSALLVLSAQASAAEAAGASAAPWWFATAALVVVVLAAVAGAVFGASRGENRLQAALRASQRERQSLQQLLDVWTWQTDAQHRLLHMHPPAGAAADAWGQAPAAGEPLWDCFEIAGKAGAAGLRARLETQAALSDLRVRAIGGSTGWTLRAQPRIDDQGRFAGHTGTARQTEGSDSAQRHLQALQQIVCEQPGPVLLATDDAAGGWQLQHANAEALRLLAGDAGAPLPAWEALLPRLPEPLQRAVAEAAAGPVPPGCAHGWRRRPR